MVSQDEPQQNRRQAMLVKVEDLDTVEEIKIGHAQNSGDGNTNLVD